jgi:hypothetical protein
MCSVVNGRRRLKLRPSHCHVSLSFHLTVAVYTRFSFVSGQSKNQGKSAVEEAIRLRKSRDAAQAHVDELRRRVIDVSSEHWEIATAELELEGALIILAKAKAKVTKKEIEMGVTARQQLRHLLKSPFLAKKMNARALKTRIRERLRTRKFELDRLERSYRKQRSGTSNHFTFYQTQYLLQNNVLTNTLKIRSNGGILGSLT